MFGNPGSTELPMLRDFPDDFRYVLGLQEAVVVGMADGFAQASGRPTLRQPAHGARASATRWARSSTRRRTTRRWWSPPASRCAPLMTMQANLTNRDATRMPHPLVKWSYEPPRAEDVPARARPRDPPREPAAEGARVRLDPDGRLGRRGRRDRASRTRSSARSPGAPPPTPPRWPSSRSGSTRRENPVLVAGPDIDASGAWDAAVALAERQQPAGLGDPGAGRRADRLPRGPPELPGRPAAGDRPGRRRRSRATTSCSSSARRCSPTTRTSPGRCCPRARRWS